MATSSRKKTETKVTRITADDAKPTRTASEKKPSREEPVSSSRERRRPFSSVGGYFKGSWQELRQVRWPDRRATWGMTGALIAFTLFFVVIILLLDYGFAQLFKLMLGS